MVKAQIQKYTRTMLNQMERDDVLLFETIKATEEKSKTSVKRRQHVEGVYEEL